MKSKIKNLSGTQQTAFVIIALGIVLRIVFFVINIVFTKGLHIDEAMLSLNAYNIAQRGRDLLGNTFPVYFSTWLDGGQSPVATYICAFFVLIFGKNLFAIRFPSLIIGILGLYTVSKFVFKIDLDDKLRVILVGLFSVSPWFIFSCVYTLDCNYVTYMIIFAIYFFILALKNNESLSYIASMFFFSLGFNAYIASVLFIPIFLAVLFIVLLIQKRITFRRTVYCFLWLVLFSIPFILFGLVATNIIPPFNIGKITFGGMESYTRADSVALSNTDGVLSRMLNNLVNSLKIVLNTDRLALNSTGINHFPYGYLLSGFFMIIGTVYIIYKFLKKNPQAQKNISFILASLVSILFFCAMDNEPDYYCSFRYSVLSIFLIPLQAVGIYAVINCIFKKFDFKKITVAYLTLTVVMFSFVYFGCYDYETNHMLLFGDSLIKCVDYLDERDINKFGIISTDFINEERRTSTYLRCYYGSDDFINFYDETACFNSDYFNSNNTDKISLSKNIDSYVYYDGFKFTEDYYIVSIQTFERIKEVPNYDVKSFDVYCLLIKQKSLD